MPIKTALYYCFITHILLTILSTHSSSIQLIKRIAFISSSLGKGSGAVFKSGNCLTLSGTTVIMLQLYLRAFSASSLHHWLSVRSSVIMRMKLVVCLMYSSNLCVLSKAWMSRKTFILYLLSNFVASKFAKILAEVCLWLMNASKVWVLLILSLASAAAFITSFSNRKNSSFFRRATLSNSSISFNFSRNDCKRSENSEGSLLITERLTTCCFNTGKSETKTN